MRVVVDLLPVFWTVLSWKRVSLCKGDHPLTKTIRINDLQLVLLAGAAGRKNGSLISLPENCRQDTARIKAITSLRRRGLVEEMAVTDKPLAWCTYGESMIGLFIAPAGRDAICAGGEECAAEKDAPQPSAPRQ